MAEYTGKIEPKNVEKAEDGVEIELRRDLGLLDITMIGIGAMIGAGIFVLIGSAAGVAGPAAVFALILNGVVTTITALAYAELGSAFPEAGGGYLWAKEGLPAPSGFLSGWMSWIAHVIACSLYAVGFGSFIAFIFTPEVSGISLGIDRFILAKIFAFIIILFFVFVNYWGAKTTGRTGIAITMSKIVILGIFSLFGIGRMIQDPSLAGRFISGLMPYDLGVILLAMGLTFVAFEGYEIIAQSGEEVKNPKKNIPKAIFISIGVVVVIYVLVFIVAFSVSPDLASGRDPDLAIIKAGGDLLGAGGIILMLVGGLLSTTSALNATVYSSSRVSFAMGRDGNLPTTLGGVHRKRRTPGNAVIYSGIIIAVMAITLPIEEIATSAGVMFLLLFIIANMSLISLRKKRPDLDRGYRVPFSPVIPLIGILLNMFLAIYIWNFPGGAGQVAWYVALFWISAGLIIHYYTGGREVIEEIPEKKVELLDYISAKVEVDKKRYRVLVPIADFEDVALVEFGAMMVKEKGGELDIMNVVEVPPNLPLSAVRFGDVDKTIKSLQKLGKTGKKAGVDTRILLKISHKVYENILEVTEEEGVNLLVLGWRGKHTKGGILGSNIDYIVQRANCEVAVFKTRGLKEKLSSILLFSSAGLHTQYAVGVAAKLAKIHNAKIVVLVVATKERTKETELQYAEKLIELCKEYDVAHELKVISSTSAISAVEKESKNHDLLVLGASPVWKMKKYAFGPLLDKLCKEVEVPVLMLRRGIS